MEPRTFGGHFYLLSTLFFIFAPATAAQHVAVDGSNSIIFPPGNNVPLLRSLSTSVHLIGASVIAYCIARRTQPNSFRASLLIKWLVLCIFIDSWLFVFGAGILISGVGLSLNAYACSAGIFLCICLYAISKLLIYSFLVEKLYIVHPHPGGRLRSPVYRFCAAFVIGYGIIIILSIVGRISFIRSDGACFIGLGRVASLTLLIYDLLLNVVFTCFFLYPIYRVENLSSRLKVIAKRTLIAAIVALLTSAINILVLTILHGKELGALCLGSCGLDTVVNALAIFAVTAPVDEAPESSNEADTHTKGIVSEVNHGRLGGFLPSRRYPRNLDVGVTSTRGILETEEGYKRAVDYKTSTRSVHFPPEITRQDRLSMAEINLEAGMGEMTLVDSDPLQTSMSRKSSKRSLKHSLKPRNEHPSAPILPRYRLSLSATSQPKQESNTNVGYDVGSCSIPPTIHAPRPPSPEMTSVEVRREGGGSLRLSRSSKVPSTWSFTNDSPPRSRGRSASVSVAGSSTHAAASSSSTSSANQSQSQTHIVDLGDEVETLSSRANSQSPSATRTLPPSTLDEARERLQVLSALTKATGGGRRSPSRAHGAPLEVSVTMQTDQRVEQKKKRQTDLIEDYSGSLYNVRGRSYSSSGGL